MAEQEPKFVTCPPKLAPLFLGAEETLGDFFSVLRRAPEQGDIQVSGVRYLLMRTESLALELQEELKKTFGAAGARQVRYKLGKACGMRDARMFHERFKVDAPDQRLALGPVHFAHMGWAFVEILPESAPQPNEGYFLVYNHPYCFESDAYLSNNLRSDHPVCDMNAGYSCGWCQVSYGVELRAEELTCRARGDTHCRFVMAHPNHVDRMAAEYKRKVGLF